MTHRPAARAATVTDQSRTRKRRPLPDGGYLAAEIVLLMAATAILLLILGAVLIFKVLPNFTTWLTTLA